MQALGERLSYNGISFYSWSPEMQSAVKSPCLVVTGDLTADTGCIGPAPRCRKTMRYGALPLRRCYARTLARWQTVPSPPPSSVRATADSHGRACAWGAEPGPECRASAWPEPRACIAAAVNFGSRMICSRFYGSGGPSLGGLMTGGLVGRGGARFDNGQLSCSFPSGLAKKERKKNSVGSAAPHILIESWRVDRHRSTMTRK